MSTKPRPPSFSELPPEKDQGVMHELWSWLKHNKKFWLLPILLLLLGLGLLIVLGGSSAAPFIYRLF